MATTVQSKYDSLHKRYQELFTRTSNLIERKRKIEKSKCDLERTIHFLRAELSMKSIFKAVDCQKGRIQMIGAEDPK